MSIEPFLLDADERAAKMGKRAYVHAVGLGLGVWMVDETQGQVCAPTCVRWVVSCSTCAAMRTSGHLVAQALWCEYGSAREAYQTTLLLTHLSLPPTLSNRSRPLATRLLPIPRHPSHCFAAHPSPPIRPVHPARTVAT